MTTIVQKWKTSARKLRTETYALYLAYRDPRVPWYARVATIIVVGLALSPIDLVPDFIPVLGYLDDLILIPLGISIILRWIPPEVMEECRQRAGDALMEGSPVGRVGTIIIVAIWLLLLALIVYWAIDTFTK